MNWFRRKPSKETLAVDAKLAEQTMVVEKQKSAVRRLLDVLDSIPIDSALANLGTDLTDVKRNGH
jgi:hypothetical protein